MAASGRSSGITLVEVMVTVAIVSVTLLGMAGLQIVALRSTNDSVYRTQAALLAGDIAERMRGNPEAVRQGFFAAVDSQTFNCAAPAAGGCTASQALPGTAEAQCAVEELATQDLSEWLCGDRHGTAPARGGIRALLPEANARITCDAVPCIADSTHTIMLEWSVPNPDRHEETADIQHLVLKIQP